METRGIVVIVVWICVTILSSVSIWVSRYLDLWASVFLLVLLCGAIAITFAMYAMSYPGFWVKQPATLSKKQMEKMSKQLEELSKQVDYIKQQLEE